jgi:hypothetical protein
MLSSSKETRRRMTLNSRLNAVYLFAVANVKPFTEKEMARLLTVHEE